jgi:hypothetical protein
MYDAKHHAAPHHTTPTPHLNDDMHISQLASSVMFIPTPVPFEMRLMLPHASILSRVRGPYLNRHDVSEPAPRSQFAMVEFDDAPEFGRDLGRRWCIRVRGEKI